MTVARDVFAVIGVACVSFSLAVLVLATFFNGCEWREDRRIRRRVETRVGWYGKRRLP